MNLHILLGRSSHTPHAQPHQERSAARAGRARRPLRRLAALVLLAGSLYGGLGASHGAHAGSTPSSTVWLQEPAGTLAPWQTTTVTYSCFGSFGIGSYYMVVDAFLSY